LERRVIEDSLDSQESMVRPELQVKKENQVYPGYLECKGSRDKMHRPLKKDRKETKDLLEILELSEGMVFQDRKESLDYQVL
jgi:hypothetical protein